MWDGLNTSVNNTSFRNYMYGNNVYLMDTITSENCAYLIGDLSTFIQNEQNRDISEINFYINSSGGEVYTALAIIGLMNLARAYDFKVFTSVLNKFSINKIAICSNIIRFIHFQINLIVWLASKRIMCCIEISVRLTL